MRDRSDTAASFLLECRFIVAICSSMAYLPCRHVRPPMHGYTHSTATVRVANMTMPLGIRTISLSNKRVQTEGKDMGEIMSTRISLGKRSGVTPRWNSHALILLDLGEHFFCNNVWQVL